VAAACDLKQRRRACISGSPAHGQRPEAGFHRSPVPQWNRASSARIGVRGASESGLGGCRVLWPCKQSRTICFTPVPVLPAPREEVLRHGCTATPLPQP